MTTPVTATVAGPVREKRPTLYGVLYPSELEEARCGRAARLRLWTDPKRTQDERLVAASVAVVIPGECDDAPSGWRDGAALIAAERGRQKSVEGWTPEHDDEHDGGELADAAVCYLNNTSPNAETPEDWPWMSGWWKPKDRISNLVRAGALIAAEIDRLQRMNTTPPGAKK